MADNTTLNPGVGGDVIATDDIGGVKHQLVKVEWGVDGVATPVSAANPLPVSDGGGSLTVDFGAALPAGTNNIGGVDVLSVPAPLNVTGSGTQAAAQRVTIATDSPIASALVTEDAAAPANPIGFPAMARVLDTVPTGLGTVSTEGDATALTASRQGALWVNIITGEQKVGGDATNGLDVDVTRLPALPAGTNNIGDVDVLSVVPGTSATSLGKAEDAAAGSGDTGVAMLAVRRDTPGTGIGADGDYAFLEVNSTGALRVDTEFVAQNLGDNMANPTAPIVGAFMMGFDGATWDRAAIDPGTGGLVVHVANGGSGGTAMIDDDVYTVESSTFTPVGGVFMSARDGTGDGDGGAFAMTGFRALYTTLESPDGHSVIDDDEDAVRVVIAAGGGSGGTAMQDDSAFTPDTTNVTPAAGVYQATRDLVDDGDAGALAMTQRRALLASIETPGGDSAMDDVNDALRVHLVTATGSVNVLSLSSSNFADIDANGETVTSVVNVGGAVAVEITGTWSGTLQFEGRVTSGWVSILAYSIGSTAPPVTSTTANGAWQIDCAGLSQVRVRASAWSSGTATVLTVMQSAAAVSRPHVVTRITDDAGDSCMDGTNNALRVSVVAGGAGGGDVQGVDAHDAALTADPLTIGGYASAAAPTGVSADGDAVRAWFLRNGAQATVLTAGGALIGGDATNGLDVDVTRMPGTVAEDGPSAGGETSVLVAAVRRDTASSGVGADGDFANLCVDSSGRLHCNVGNMVSVDTELPAAGALADNMSNPTTPLVGSCLMAFDGSTWDRVPNGNGAAAAALRVTIANDSTGIVGATCAGAAAHDAAVSGNPVLVGFEARTTAPTAVANGDAVRAQADSLGKQVVLMGAPHELDVQGDITLTNTTAANVIAAQGSGVKVVVTNLVITNHHASQATKVEIRDGTTVLMQVSCAAGGGGVALANPRGILKSSANAAITARCVTTGADVDVFATGYTVTNG